MTRKVWGGRFRAETDALVNRFNASIDFDLRLYGQDIEGSMAHCRMLAKQEIITDDDASLILEALGEIKRELDRGQFPADDEYEDINLTYFKVSRSLNITRRRMSIVFR